MIPIIRKIVYLTHDKWKDKVEVKHRAFFIDYLSKCIELDSKVIESLSLMLEYQDKEDRLLIMRGVILTIEKLHPDVHKSIMTRYYSDIKKKDMYKSLLEEKEN